jgi:MHS family shikimate/dehydroshikimate transporter-like MFS transporter
MGSSVMQSMATGALAAVSSSTGGKGKFSRSALAATVGTTVEWYDFQIYGLAAALVFNAQFFPGVDPVAGTLLAFATFAVGFFARPIGAAIFGHMGDRIDANQL